MENPSETDIQKALHRKLAAWSERVEIARAHNKELEQAASEIVSAYEALLESGGPEPAQLVEANKIRKQLEAAEQHRTMSAEHGLNDEAIDVTYEIQELESQLIVLVRRWKNR